MGVLKTHIVQMWGTESKPIPYLFKDIWCLNIYMTRRELEESAENEV